MGIISVLFQNPINYILIFFFMVYLLYTYLLERFILEFFVRLGLLISACLLGVFLATAYSHDYDNKISLTKDNSVITITGTITSKEVKNDKLSVVISGCEIGGDLLVYCDDLALENSIFIHSKVKATGTISHFKGPRNPGEFDSKNYYLSRRILMRFYANSIETLTKPTFPISENLYQLRKHLSNVFYTNLAPDEASILSSITTGDRSELTTEIKDIFKSGGISHILCVSGMHISLLGSILLWLLKKMKINRHIALILTCIFTLFYSMLCGMSVSTIRALATFFVQAVAFFLKRQYDRLGTLSIIMIAMLITNPLLVLNSGFIFSFWAVFSFTVIAETGASNKLVDALLLQSFSMPIVALYYYEIPILSFAVNLILVPYLGVILCIGLLGGLIGLVIPSLSVIILIPCKIILRAYIYVCDLIDKLPFSQIITGKPSPLKLVLYFIILFGIVILIQKKPRYKFIISSASVAILTLLLSIWPASKSNITFLDVGQGDGIFITDSVGTTYFIDGGSTSKNEIGRFSILPFLKYKGIKSVDYWIISHADSDHVNGLIELIESGYEVTHIIIASNSPASENLEHIQSLAHSKKIPITKVSGKDVIHANSSGASLTVLWPDKSFVPDDINAASLSFLYEDEGFFALFTGDISAEEENKIVPYATMHKTLDIDILKVAHHGSKYSSSERFLEAFSPETAIISCGINNRYHHPHKESLERLSAVGCNTLRTDNLGAITVNYNKNDYSIQPFLADYRLRQPQEPSAMP